MSKTPSFYQVKRVFLSCPGDLVSERSRFPKILETVNNLRAHSLGFHLEAVGWERVIPSFGRPQQLINEELRTADLVIVMFWNRLGSQSGKDSEVTGTLEEFNLAVRLHDETAKRQFDANKPVVWVYFRVPTAEPDDQLRGVLAFRKKLEEGRQLFFREYTSVEDWEEMLRQHLVAYLGDLHRWDLDHNRESMRPELRLIQGDFLAEGIYDFGNRLKLQVDLDGDGSPELVTFWFAVNSYNLTITKHDSTFALPLSYQTLENARLVHVAIKDVTNDGLPEVLLAASDGPASLRLYVWGLNQSGRQERKLSEETFVALADFAGQYRAQIFEGGPIVLPYGSQGFAFRHRWNVNQFENIGD
jgi:hypothetical protein